MGLHKSVNDGIVFLLKEGKVDGASLMPNGEEFEYAVKACRENGLKEVGVHLNLVEQNSLVTGKPLAKNHRIFFLKYILGLISKHLTKKELEMQINKCIGAGIRPVFVNGNQHLHLLPEVMDTIIELAKKYQIPYIRIVSEPIKLSSGKFFRKAQLTFLNFLSRIAKNKIKKAGLQCNDFFVGFVNAGNLSEKDIKFAKSLAEKYPNRIIELGCHPGYESEELKEKYKHWVDYNWQKEFDLLMTNDKLTMLQ